MCAHTCPVNEAATTWDADATRARPPSNLISFKNVSVGKYKSCDDGAILALPLAFLDAKLGPSLPSSSRLLAVSFAHVAPRAALLPEVGVFANLGRKAARWAKG